ncbi:transferase domain protein [Mycobacterium kansasii]|uniref:Transferase domain protein n=1 Tax=Mycobacterium kansasii TaxID=1768 RepID=A0A1V3X842_MYCKA|nr:transferase domain protein [Mycobacterium kansasii]
MLLGDSYHPGGAALTRRLADQLGLRPGKRVADVAAGRAPPLGYSPRNTAWPSTQSSSAKPM